MSDRENYPDRPLVPTGKQFFDLTSENWTIRRAGWCPACKAAIEKCACDEAGDPRELDFG